jgi:hypothetical protein
MYKHVWRVTFFIRFLFHIQFLNAVSRIGLFFVIGERTICCLIVALFFYYRFQIILTLTSHYWHPQELISHILFGTLQKQRNSNTVVLKREWPLTGLCQILQSSAIPYLQNHTQIDESRDSSVGIATGYWLNYQGVGYRVPVRQEFSLSPCSPDRLWGLPNPLSNVNGRTLFPGVKQPVREAVLSPPTSAEVKKTWVYTTTPPYVFMAQCWIS